MIRSYCMGKPGRRAWCAPPWGCAQAPVLPQRHVWPLPQPQPQPDWLVEAAWQPQVQLAPAQFAQRQAKVSVVFIVLSSLGWETGTETRSVVPLSASPLPDA